MSSLTALGLDKYKKGYVQVSPKVDPKDEFTEVQVLEEVFDPDHFLDQLECLIIPDALHIIPSCSLEVYKHPMVVPGSITDVPPTDSSPSVM